MENIWTILGIVIIAAIVGVMLIGAIKSHTTFRASLRRLVKHEKSIIKIAKKESFVSIAADKEKADYDKRRKSVLDKRKKATVKIKDKRRNKEIDKHNAEAKIHNDENQKEHDDFIARMIDSDKEIEVRDMPRLYLSPLRCKKKEKEEADARAAYRQAKADGREEDWYNSQPVHHGDIRMRRDRDNYNHYAQEEQTYNTIMEGRKERKEKFAQDIADRAAIQKRMQEVKQGKYSNRVIRRCR